MTKLINEHYFVALNSTGFTSISERHYHKCEQNSSPVSFSISRMTCLCSPHIWGFSFFFLSAGAERRVTVKNSHQLACHFTVVLVKVFFAHNQTLSWFFFTRNFMAFSVSCENLFEKQELYIYVCVCVQLDFVVRISF